MIKSNATLYTSQGLKYDLSDVGKSIQMFSFRFNSWENVEILDFEQSKMLHQCKNSDGTSSWIDLKKKPIRGSEI